MSADEESVVLSHDSSQQPVNVNTGLHFPSQDDYQQPLEKAAFNRRNIPNAVEQDIQLLKSDMVASIPLDSTFSDINTTKLLGTDLSHRPSCFLNPTREVSAMNI